MAPHSTPISLDLTIESVGNDIRIGARGSRGENVPLLPLGIHRDAVEQFAARIARAAAYGQSLPSELLAQAQALQKAVLADEIGTLFIALSRAAAPNPILLRLMVQRDLQNVPWEALCNPGESLGFWGTSPKILPVRGVATTDPWTPREVRGAVKVLAIAPTASTGLPNLKLALEERIAGGEIEWLEPVEGIAARVPSIFDRLRREPAPHVLHFLGHGGMNKAGQPCLRMGDDDDDEKWLPTELLAQQLGASFRNTLRLIVLEACAGAEASQSDLLSDAFVSSAQILARDGADAVVAYQWPVKADIARTCSTLFYRALLSTTPELGDAAFALNQARLAALATYDNSAAALNPVLYLRGPDGRIFDFERRRIEAPRAQVVERDEPAAISPALARITAAPFSLVLGDRWKDDRIALESFRSKLLSELANGSKLPAPNGLPMGTLMQWFALHKGSELLEEEFQEAFDLDMAAPRIVSAISHVVCPGVHTTLLRNPWFEHSVAEHQPGRTIYVIQPYDAGAFVVKRVAGAGKRWERLRSASNDFDDSKDILILRPYRGYTSNKKFARPLLTEDDYFLRLRDVWSGDSMPPHLAEVIGGTLGRRPALLVGLSMLTANHRMLLHTLYARGLPRKSLAVVDEADHERQLWEKGTGLPGKDDGVDVLETSSTQLCAMLELMGHEVKQ